MYITPYQRSTLLTLTIFRLSQQFRIILSWHRLCLPCPTVPYCCHNRCPVGLYDTLPHITTTANGRTLGRPTAGRRARRVGRAGRRRHRTRPVRPRPRMLPWAPQGAGGRMGRCSVCGGRGRGGVRALKRRVGLRESGGR